MKSFNIPQPIFQAQNTPKIPQSKPENTNNGGISNIASQLMNMFDPFKLNNSLLNKRSNPNVDDAVEEELQKKLKTAALASSFHQASSVNPLANLLLQQNLLMNPSFGALQNKGLPDLFDPLRLQNLQNLNLLLNLNQSKLQENLSNISNVPAQPQVQPQKTAPKASKATAKTQKSPSKLNIKEEYLNQEDVHTSHESPMSVKRALSDHKSTNDTTSEVQEEKIPVQFTPLMVEEPVLAEYTRMFPDWDLATIFNYLKSEKSMQEFEKDRLQRLEKKMKRKSGPKTVKAAAPKPKVSVKPKNTLMNKPVGLLQF